MRQVLGFLLVEHPLAGVAAIMLSLMLLWILWLWFWDWWCCAGRRRSQSIGHEFPPDCRYCGAGVKDYVITGRTHKGRIGSYDLSWTCGTWCKVGLMGLESEYHRGDRCISKQESKGVQDA